MVYDGNIEPFGGKTLPKMLVNFYQALWCHALSCSPMTVKFDKHFSCLDTCHIVGMVNFYKCDHNIYLSVPSEH